KRFSQHQFCFSKTFLRLPPRAEALTAALGTAGHRIEVQGLRPCTPLGRKTTIYKTNIFSGDTPPMRRVSREQWPPHCGKQQFIFVPKKGCFFSDLMVQ
ncbi:MAG: hypothetical protein J6D21_02215, partial [Clostridia bacterium]|nr:hypothetical protein [Clostridia bacterium]